MPTLSFPLALRQNALRNPGAVSSARRALASGGASVYPAEIEGALAAHPGVQASAVIGLPDEDLGQRVHAIVQARPGVDDDALRAHLEGQLERYKIPRSFEYVEGPLRDESGKLCRTALRAARLPKS